MSQNETKTNFDIVNLDELKIALKSKIDLLQINNVSDISTLVSFIDDLIDGRIVSQSPIMKESNLPQKEQFTIQARTEKLNKIKLKLQEKKDKEDKAIREEKAIKLSGEKAMLKEKIAKLEEEIKIKEELKEEEVIE